MAMMIATKTCRVTHLVPKDGLGGVEAAIRSIRPEQHKDLQVFYMAGPQIKDCGSRFRSLSPSRSLNSPVIYLLALRALLRARPEVLVCSLWRATLVGVIAKLFRPQLKLVVMIHATSFAHSLDRVVTAMGCRIATEVWCDSEASKQFVHKSFNRSASVISFLVPASSPVDKAGQREALDFVYWGRHVHLKNVPRAVRLFNRILAICPQARLFIYGQEGPASEDIRQAMREAEPGSIKLMGAKPPGEYPDPIPSCTFFLMTSKQEGMAVAVVEAMQLGLIPVVTPVGEIATYCQAEHNAIIVMDDEQAALDVVQVARDDVARSRMSVAAIEKWVDRNDYSTDFKRAYERLLASQQSSTRSQSQSDE